MRRINTVQINIRLAGLFLVILFCGYFGSTAFFHHTHIINGFSVVHSHPYKSHSGNGPISHNHSKDGLLLIQFISGFITTAPPLFIGIAITSQLLPLLFPEQEKSIILRFFLIGANRPRAPSA